MDNIEEIFDDIGDKVEGFFDKLKKKLKDNPFLIACLVVALFALYVYFKGNNSSTSAGSEMGGEYYYPTGYSGYPTTDSSGSSTGVSTSTESEYLYNEFQSVIDTMEKEYQSKFDEIYDIYDTTTDELYSNIEDLNTTITEQQTTIDKQTADIQRQQIISAMKSNSNLYNELSGSQYAAKREQLHAENMKLAEMLGAEYDDKTGAYYIDGERLYMSDSEIAKNIAIVEGKTPTAAAPVEYASNVDYQKEIINTLLSGGSVDTVNTLNAKRNAKITATGKNKSEVNQTYDKNIDYQAAIDAAVKSGADKDVIDNLKAQRAAKIKGENLTQYM